MPVSSQPHPLDSNGDKRTLSVHLTTNTAVHAEKHFIKLRLYLNTVIAVIWAGTASAMHYSEMSSPVYVSSGLCSFIYLNKVVHNSGICRDYTSVENYHCKLYKAFIFTYLEEWNAWFSMGKEAVPKRIHYSKSVFLFFFFNKILSCSYLYK